MILLDENIPEDQRILLRRWRIPFRQVGREVWQTGTSDEDIIPLLHQLHRAAFFTQDSDFFRRDLCHSRYALIFVHLTPGRIAEYIRRFLKHPAFKTREKRMGVVARLQPEQVQYWRKGEPRLQTIGWANR